MKELPYLIRIIQGQELLRGETVAETPTGEELPSPDYSACAGERPKHFVRTLLLRGCPFQIFLLLIM